MTVNTINGTIKIMEVMILIKPLFLRLFDENFNLDIVFQYCVLEFNFKI